MDPSKLSTRVYEILLSYFGFSSENEVYGNLRIINEYAQVPDHTRLIGRIQHGWVSGKNSRTSINNNILDSFVWSSTAENTCKNLGFKNVIAIGAPWLYLLENMKSRGFGENLALVPRGIGELWILGAHSVSISKNRDQSRLYEFLEAAHNSPCRKKWVLLFYTDYYSLSKSDFEKYPDLVIITALGSRLKSSSADAHLYTMFFILLQAEFLILDAPTTAILYGLSLGCRVKWFKNASYSETLQSAIERNDLSILNLLENGEHFTQEEGFVFSMEELGHESIKSPQEIRSLFGWDKEGLKLKFRIRKLIEFLLKAPFRFRTIRYKY